MKISIVTAVYNSAATVGQAIDSVSSQTHNDIEHVIIDGKSTDGSLDIIRKHARPNLRIVSEPDSGIYNALNKGIALATGDVVGFVHSNDFLAHDRVLETIAATFEAQDIDAVYADLHYVSEFDTSNVVRYWRTGEYSQGRLQRGWMPAHPTLYVRRDLYERLGSYNECYRTAADYDFALRFFSRPDQKSVYIPDVFYKMRLGGISNYGFNNIRRKTLEDLEILRSHKVGGRRTLAMKNLSKLSQFVQFGAGAAGKATTVTAQSASLPENKPPISSAEID